MKLPYLRIEIADCDKTKVDLSTPYTPELYLVVSRRCLHARERQMAEMLALIEELHDEDPCRYADHDRNQCRAHYHFRPCPHGRAKALLANLVESEEEPSQPSLTEQSALGTCPSCGEVEKCPGHAILGILPGNRPIRTLADTQELISRQENPRIWPL